MHDDPDDALELTTPLVPLFIIAGGRALPQDSEYEHTTMITAGEATAAAARTLAPETRAIMDLIADGYLSVAEVAAHTRLPLGVVRIMLAQLAEDGLIHVRNPVPHAERHDPVLLNAVLDGLMRIRTGA
ncbi:MULTISPECIES: DUF742 domain-containing protein [unclassified Streptomyces]|uniref:DUF742 domain-containing protein n=1 Tax=unclassified Streptomyces TaxID=2593676 RepID=UPI001661A960|nr:MULTISPECIES: DUF742 domain-containing protein [unclassified Streptomyces]MBD0838884.1 DUF742 domain-containing protein [Streptomyces sp. TRM68416]